MEEKSCSPWIVNIGLEVHARVISERKLFSSSRSCPYNKPNTLVSLVDVALPGTLPVVNWYCVEQAIRTGLALNSKINQLSIFERKNYFYPDLPHGYQISQYRYPLALGGYLDLEFVEGKTKRIGISRIQLEQDSGKSIHDIHPEKSHIDLNRSGVALMEIVSEPEIRSFEEVRLYLTKLRNLLINLGTSDGNMEHGSFRVDVNISLSQNSSNLGTRVEIKNVNSFRFIEQSIRYEIDRQLELLKHGLDVKRETRLFDQKRRITSVMRPKEEDYEYCYLPDPDLPPLVISQREIERIRKELPELSGEREESFARNFSLLLSEAKFFLKDRDSFTFYEKILQSLKAREDTRVARVLFNIVVGFGNSFVTMIRTNHKDFEFLVSLVLDGKLSIEVVRNILAKFFSSHDRTSLKELIEEEKEERRKEKSNFYETVDEDVLDIVNQVIKNQSDKIREYRSGNIKLLNFFVGQVTKQINKKIGHSVSQKTVYFLVKNSLETH